MFPASSSSTPSAPLVPPACLDKPVILLVDDDAGHLILATRVLNRAGHPVLTARNGAEALDALAATDCQIVISDSEMRPMSGIELCQAIRALNGDRYIYTLLLTAHSSLPHRLSGYAAGADDFLEKPFNPDDLLSRINVALRTVSLESADITIFALAKLAESRDPETGLHLERVQRYCRVLAQHVLATNAYPGQIDAALVRLLYETSPLHDIGKVAIPDAVLLKPGKLTPDEFEVMKRHTTHGANTLAAAAARRPGARFLQVATEIAATHHEKWDGSGYPLGLRGDEIPLSGRIVAVADVYDALSSRRVYKAAFAPDEVRRIILEGRGRHFDPRLVDAFIEVEPEFLAISARFAEPAAPVQPAAQPLKAAA